MRISDWSSDVCSSDPNLSDADKETLKALNSELASLQTTFSQNVLKETNASAIVVDTRDELAGLSDNEIAAAAQAAKAAGKDGKFMLAMMNTSGQPALASLETRALRARILETSFNRGSHGDRKSVVSGKGVSVRVRLGGRRLIKKK